MHERYYKIIICGCLFALGKVGLAARASAELPITQDCTRTELEAVIDQDAPREDNLARLSKQFYLSVNTIDQCDREPESDAPAASPDNNSASLQDEANDVTSDTGSESDSETGTPENENTSKLEADSPRMARRRVKSSPAQRPI